MKLAIKETDLLNLVKVDLIENARVIKETLSRMGTGNSKTKTIFQICHLIKIKQQWYLIHYKETYLLRGKSVFWREEDIIRRNEIAKFLEKWSLLKIINKDEIDFSHGFDVSDFNNEEDKMVFRIRHSARKDWNMKTRVNINSFNDLLMDWNEEE